MALNTGGHAFRRMRRSWGGRGVEYRRSTPLAGAGANTPIPVAGMKSTDELVSVLHLVIVALEGITDIIELLTETATPAVQAALTSVFAGGNNDITLNAQSAFEGAKGNSLSIEYLNNGASKPLQVDVIEGAGGQETKVSVQLATDAGSVILSTANQVIDAITAHPQAASMLMAEVAEGTGDAAVTALAAASLAGGVDAYPANVIKVVTVPVQASLTTALGGANDDLVFNASSIFPGTKGNSLSVEYLNNGASKPLVVDVIAGVGGQETKISVQLATNAASAILSTANDIIEAVESHPQASEMVHVENAAGNDGSGVVTALAATSLAGGLDESVAVQTPTVTTGNKLMVDFLSHA